MNKYDSWNKKPRTMLRFLKNGDIFAYLLDNKDYAFGQLISKTSIGHVAEFFDARLPTPDIGLSDFHGFARVHEPLIIDSYSLFDRKSSGDWRIIGHQANFEPTNVDDVRFTYGNGHEYWAVNIRGEKVAITKAASQGLPKYSPQEDWDVREIIVPLLRRREATKVT